MDDDDELMENLKKMSIALQPPVAIEYQPINLDLIKDIEHSIEQAPQDESLRSVVMQILREHIYTPLTVNSICYLMTLHIPVGLWKEHTVLPSIVSAIMDADDAVTCSIDSNNDKVYHIVNKRTRMH